MFLYLTTTYLGFSDLVDSREKQYYADQDHNGLALVVNALKSLSEEDVQS